MDSIRDFLTLSLASKESTFQTANERSFGDGGPGLGSTSPDWRSKSLNTKDMDEEFIMQIGSSIVKNDLHVEGARLLAQRRITLKKWRMVIQKISSITKASRRAWMKISLSISNVDAIRWEIWSRSDSSAVSEEEGLQWELLRQERVPLNVPIRTRHALISTIICNGVYVYR